MIKIKIISNSKMRKVFYNIKISKKEQFGLKIMYHFFWRRKSYSSNTNPILRQTTKIHKKILEDKV